MIQQHKEERKINIIRLEMERNNCVQIKKIKKAKILHKSNLYCILKVALSSKIHSDFIFMCT